LDTVKNLSFDLINEETVSLKWQMPVTFDRMIEGYFDDRVILFARVTDIYGGVVENLEKAKINVVARISTNQFAPNFFDGETEVGELKPEDTFTVASTLVGADTIKGVFRMVDNPRILASLNFILAVLDVSFSIPDITTGADKFTVFSTKIGIRLLNPLNMSQDPEFGDSQVRGGASIVQTRRASIGSGDGGANQTGENTGEEGDTQGVCR
jgi:hypothetical protein